MLFDVLELNGAARYWRNAGGRYDLTGSAGDHQGRTSVARDPGSQESKYSRDR